MAAKVVNALKSKKKKEKKNIRERG